jgi:hypothetical protein
MTIDHRHRWTAATEIGQLEGVQMVVLGPPVNAAGANAGGLLDGLGYIGTDVELLLPQQRVGPQAG